MRPVVHRLELLDAHLRVLLRRGEARVSEQLLDDADVRSSGEEVGGERMPERVWAHPPLQRELEHRSVEMPGHAPGGEAPTSVVEEQGRGVLAGRRLLFASSLDTSAHQKC